MILKNLHYFRQLLLSKALSTYKETWYPYNAMYYLLKTEPSEYSFSDLQRDKTTVWDGISNPVALRNLRDMPAGAKLAIYHTGGEKQVVGTATAVSVNASDPKNPQVTIKATKPLDKPITLAELKSNNLFKDSPLVRQGRLSVVPLTAAQYAFIAKYE